MPNMQAILVALSPGEVQPGCRPRTVVLGPSVERVLAGQRLGSSPEAREKCQHLQLGKGNLAREAALRNPRAPLAPR